MKSKVLLLLAVVAGLLAAGSVYLYMEKLGNGQQQQETVAKVVVAKETVPAKTKITAAMLNTLEMPASYIHPNAIKSVDEVAGTVASSTLYVGEQVLEPRLVRPGDSSQGVAYIITKGKRAMALKVDQVVGVAGFLVPGDRVDIVVHLQLNEQDVITRILAQDIRLLAVGPYLSRGKPAEPLKEMDTVTVEVSPEEALALVMGVEEGLIRLLLRPAVAEGSVAVPIYHREQLGQ